MASNGMTIGGFSSEAVADIKAITNEVFEVATKSVTRATAIMETLNGKAKNNNTESASYSIKTFSDNISGLFSMYKDVVGTAMTEVINLGNKINDDGMIQGGKTIQSLLEDCIVKSCPESGIVPAGEEVQTDLLDQINVDLFETIKSTTMGFADLTPKIRAMATGGSTGTVKVYSDSFSKFHRAMIPVVDELQKVVKDYGEMQNDAFNNLRTWKSRTNESAAEAARGKSATINEQIEGARKNRKNAVESML